MYSLMNSDSISKMKNRQTLENKWPAVSRIPTDRQSSSEPPFGSSSSEDSERDRLDGEALSLPSFVAGSGTLDRLVDTARDYARAAVSDNTLRAYAKDWAHFARWCRMKGAEPLPPSAEMIGLYLADLASGSPPSPCMFP